ncbi:MAG: ABC transporter ATP-binding protein [Granulosicoccus sp.]|nr:ABC transporter ATP-binding protein [Granulosicoccus sp.]
MTRKFADAIAVDNISFSVERGQVLGLLGLNGAGKTSSLRMLAGVLEPDAGEILINGESLQHNPITAKRQIGYLPEVAPLYTDMKVHHYLDYAARLRRMNRQERRRQVDKQITDLDLLPVANRRIGHLSKGYKQRVGIAQAIIHDPALVILDEPSSGLDPEQMRDMRKLVKTLGKTHGVIFSSHLLGEVNEVCTHVSVLHQGRMIHSGSMSESSQPGNYRVRFAQSISEQQLRFLPGIEDVESLGPETFRLSSQSVAGHQLLTTMIKAEFTVTEFSPYETSLEMLFSSLVRTPDVTSTVSIDNDAHSVNPVLKQTGS